MPPCLPSGSIYCAWATRKNKDKLNKLVLEQARETDKDKRLALLNKIHQILREEPGGAILFGLNQIYAMSDRMEYSWLPMEAYLFYLHRINVIK